MARVCSVCIALLCFLARTQRRKHLALEKSIRSALVDVSLRRKFGGNVSETLATTIAAAIAANIVHATSRCRSFQC
jgi:hypothetical protein